MKPITSRLIPLFLLAISFTYSQTVVLDIEGSTSTTICEGSPIQINATATPPSANYYYTWTNLTTGQWIQGNANSFLIISLDQTSEIQVSITGGPAAITGSITVTVIEPPSAGTDGSLFLCNQTGTIDLFTILQNSPDVGGTWSPPLSGGDGNFVVGTDVAGEYTYTVTSIAPCPPTYESKVIVKDCFDVDYDNDGVLNDVDLDDDNDGILDSVENAICTPSTLTEALPIVDIDFGEGLTPTTDSNVIGHNYAPTWPSDGFYNVGTSTYFATSAPFIPVFITTESNPIPHIDGGGTTDGRYLAINIGGGVDVPIYQVDNIPIQTGTEYNFSIDMAGLCTANDCTDIPILELELLDQNLPAGSPPLYSTTSVNIGVANDDIWRNLTLNFTATTDTFLTLVIRNQQPYGASGNDLGIDNIRFAQLECDFDLDLIPNYLDLDSDNDGIFDIIEAGNPAVVDANNDGIADGPVDANGVPVSAGGGTVPVNSDNAEFYDFLDVDADNDGIQDNIEGQATFTYVAPSGIDDDDNGVDDIYDSTNTPLTPVDTDGDDLPDYLDLNSDDDCLDDNIEAYDLNQDGVADTLPSGIDTDNDGMDDNYDTVELTEVNSVVNPSDGGELPTNLPDNHNPGNDVDFREENTGIIEEFELSFCADPNPINLFDTLVETAIPGGTWTGPSVLSGGELGTYDPTVNVPGTYVYSLPTIGTCPERKGEISVLIGVEPDAGLDGTVTLCDDTTSTTDLFTILGGSPDSNGVWTPTLDSGTGVFDPMTDSAGTYTYTIATPGCPTASSEVVVTLNTAADAGNNGNLDVCSTDNAIDLFTLLGGTPDAGGIWTPTLNSGTGVFDPSLDNSGAYVYTIDGVTPCTNATATVDVNVINAPDAGLDGNNTLCSTGNSMDLFDNLGGTPETGGTWSPTLASGTGVFDPSTDSEGTYTYTVTGTTPCANATAEVTVTIITAPNAGTDGSLSLCSNDTSIDLFSQLGDNPDTGGTWTPTLSSTTGIFDPSTDSEGTYTYTIDIAGCSITSSEVIVNINVVPNAGTDSALTLCSNDASIDLFTQLGGTPDTGGTWSPALSSGTSIFDPSTDSEGTYTYTITGTAPCSDATAEIAISIATAPDPGADSTLTVCSTGTTMDLFSQLGGTPDVGGTWSPLLASGTGNFDPSIDPDGTYTYTVIGETPCANATSEVIVTVTASPNAGTDGTLTICSNDTSTDLFAQLGGNPDTGGVWTPTLSSGTGVLDPSIDSEGTYTYTIDVSGCAPVSSEVIININAVPNAGTDGSLTICASATTTDLFSQLGGIPDAGGTWSPALSSGTGVFDPSIDPSGTYTYTIIGATPCVNATSEVAVTVTGSPNAGTNGTLTLCSNDTSTNLFTQLGGTPDTGGIWSPTLSSGTGVFDPSTDSEGTYTYTIDIFGCAPVSSEVMVSINAIPNGGTNGSLTICSTAAVTDLFSQLGGTPDAGGTWFPALSSGTGIFDPSIDPEGTYTYTVLGNTPCANATAEVVVAVTASPNAGTDGTLAICTNDASTDLFSQLGGNPDTGGIWTPALSSGTGVFDPSIDPEGTYTYTLNSADCNPEAATVVVSIVSNPIFNQPDMMTACDDVSSDEIESFDLNDQSTTIIGGQTGIDISFHVSSADAISDLNPLTSPYSNISNPQTIYVRLENANNCITIGTFEISVNASPNAITPTDFEICDDMTADGINSFDLNIKNSEISGNDPSYLLTYHETLIDAQNDSNPLSIPYANTTPYIQQIFVRVEDTNTGCHSIVPLNLVVEQGPSAISPTPLESCDPDSDGFGVFTLTDAELEITGGANLTISYHETEADANNNVNSLSSPYNNIVANAQTIYVRIENATTTSNCVSFVELELIVNPTPQITAPTALEICDDDNADGFASFDLTIKNPEILNALDDDISNDLDSTQFVITYYETLINAETAMNAISTPNAYVNTSNPQTIHIRVEDIANDCYSLTTLELIVNSLPLLTQPDPLSLCDYNNPGDEIEAFVLEDANAQILNGQTDVALTFYSTQNGADTADSTAQITSPYLNTSNAQTIYVRAQNNATGCASTITLDLRVNPIPSPEAMPEALEYCDDDNDGFGEFDLDAQTDIILNGEPGITISFHETEIDANTATNPLSSPYTNIVANTQIIWVRAENTGTANTPATGCFTVVQLPLIVLPSPVIPLEIDDYIVCDDDLDGFSEFDFDATISPQIFTSIQTPTDFTLTYHTSQTDADTGNNPIVNTSSFTNQITPQQTIYIRLESNANDCVSTGSFIIKTALPPEVDVNYDNELSQCDDLDADYMEDNDGYTTFDLTVENIEITGSTNASWIVTYYETLLDAQNDTNAIVDPTSYDNTMNGPQTLHVRVTDNDTGCFSFTTLTIRVLPVPSPSPDPMDLELCDDTDITANDMIEVFDLTLNETFIINGENGVSTSYYINQTDAIAGTNAIVDPTMHSNEDPSTPGLAINPQTIYVRVTNGIDQSGTGGTGCYSLVSFNLIVNPLPTTTPVDDYVICELNTDDTALFDLETMTDSILAGQDPTVFTVTYHETMAEAEAAINAINGLYTNTSDPQPIFVNITNTTTGCYITTLSFNLRVDEAALANPDDMDILYEICDDNMEFDEDPANDVTQFDLSTQTPFVLDGQSPTDYTVSYYETQEDANMGSNPLPVNYENITNPQLIYARVDNDTSIGGTDSSTCYETTTLTLQVNPIPAFDLDDDYMLCINTNGTEVIDNPIIDTGLDANLYSFEWSYENTVLTGQTGPTLVPTNGGNYTVVVTDISTSPNTMCSSSDSVFVTVSEPPIATAEVITLAFADQHDIQVTISSTTANSIAEYEYSIDGGPWEMDSPSDGIYVFSNVSAGEHTIMVRDINGCGETSIIVMVIDYPPYFTPNGDEYHDTWNIYGLDNQPGAVIYVFDRYGKLLKQLSPTGNGWNGRYNGKHMPANDYWFTVEYLEPQTNEKKSFGAHFTLKR